MMEAINYKLLSINYALRHSVTTLTFLLHGASYGEEGSDTWVWKGSRHLRASLPTAQSQPCWAALPASWRPARPSRGKRVVGVSAGEQRWGAAAAGNSPAARESNAGRSRRPPQPPGRAGEQLCGRAPATWSLPPSGRQRSKGQPPRGGESKTKRELVKRSFQTWAQNLGRSTKYRDSHGRRDKDLSSGHLPAMGNARLWAATKDRIRFSCLHAL